MAEFLQRLYQGQPTSTSGEMLFEVEAAQAAIVKHVEIINIEPAYGLSDSITLWVVGPPDLFPDDTNIWIPETDLGPSERLSWGGGDTMALETGCSIWAAVLGGGSNAILNVIITGMVVDEPASGS